MQILFELQIIWSKLFFKSCKNEKQICDAIMGNKRNPFCLTGFLQYFPYFIESKSLSEFLQLF